MIACNNPSDIYDLGKGQAHTSQSDMPLDDVRHLTVGVIGHWVLSSHNSWSGRSLNVNITAGMIGPWVWSVEDTCMKECITRKRVQKGAWRKADRQTYRVNTLATGSNWN